MLHIIGQKYIAETSDKLFWDLHAISKTIQEKVATNLKEHKHRSALLHKDPRTGCGAKHRASWALQNQEKKAGNMSREFTPEHDKSYKELSTSVTVALPEIKTEPKTKTTRTVRATITVSASSLIPRIL